MRKLLTAIVGAYVLLVGLYSGLIPPFEGPDGPQHWAYVVWLAEGRGLPPQGEEAWETPVRQEASQPPLYYWLASLPARLVGVNDPPAVYRPNPHFPSNAPGTVADNKNVAIHYPADTRPLQGGWLALYLARGVSLAFGVVLLISVHRLGRAASPGQPQIASIATLAVALNPQVLLLSGVVSNDVPAAALGALVLWSIADLVSKGPTTGRSLATGVAFGLAALTKTSTLALGLPLLVWMVWAWHDQTHPRREVLRGAFIIAVSTALVAGWWYGRSWILYGAPLGLDTHYQAPWALTDGAARSASAGAEWLEVFYSFWAAAGWGNIKFPGWAYLPAFAMVVAAGAGLVLLALRHWRARRGLARSAVMAIVLGLAVLGVGIALVSWMQQVRAPHGRLLFPALAAIALLLAVGWRALHRSLPWLGIGYLAVLSVTLPGFLIRPAYRPPGTMAEPDRPSLGWRYGEIAELISVNPLARSAAAGSMLPVEVCWRPLSRGDKDYSVLVHLVGPENQIAAARHTYPGLGSYPTTVWEPGRPFCDQIRLDITPDLAQTLVYQIEIGLLDDATMERLPARDREGQPLSSTFAGAVRLVAADGGQRDGEPLGDDPIRLVNYDYDPHWQPGNDHDLILRWFMAEPLERDYTVMIHLRRLTEDQTIAQADGPPLDNWYPTSWWEAGETVVDRHVFTLPPDVPPGRYRLVVGWYDPATGERLGSEHALGDVEVGS